MYGCKISPLDNRYEIFCFSLMSEVAEIGSQNCFGGVTRGDKDE